MDKVAFLQACEETFDLTPGTIAENPGYDLSQAWDSLSLLSMLAVFDSQVKKTVEVSALQEIKTVDELLALAELS